MKRGPAKALPDVEQTIAQSDDALRWIVANSVPNRQWPAFQEEAEVLIEALAKVRRELLEHLHGTASPGRTMNLMELHRVIVMVQEEIPRFLVAADAFGGPSVPTP